MRKYLFLVIAITSLDCYAQLPNSYTEFQSTLQKVTIDIADGSLDDYLLLAELLSYEIEIATLTGKNVKEIRKIGSLNGGRELFQVINWFDVLKVEWIRHNRKRLDLFNRVASLRNFKIRFQGNNDVSSDIDAQILDIQNEIAALDVVYGANQNFEDIKDNVDVNRVDVFDSFLEIGSTERSGIEFQPGGVRYIEISQGGAFTNRFSYVGDLTYSFLHNTKNQKHRIGLQVGTLTDGNNLAGTLGFRFVKLVKPIEDRTLGSLANLQFSSALLYSISTNDSYDNDIIFNIGIGAEVFQKALLYLKTDYNISESFFTIRTGIGLSINRKK